MDNEKPAEKMSEGRFSPNDNDRGYINGREKDPTCDLERGYLDDKGRFQRAESEGETMKQVASLYKYKNT